MRAYWLDHDHLEIPVPAGGGEGEPIADGMITVTDADPRFDEWRRWALNARPDPEPSE